MEIRDIDFHLVRTDANDGGPLVRSLLVCLTSDAGEEGWGEAPSPGDGRSFPRGAIRCCRRWRAERVRRGRAGHLDAVDSPALASALEMAGWDLVGRVLGQPLCHLWGGCYVSGFP